MQNRSMVYYNKLVRDKIPDRIKEHGDNPVYHAISYDSYPKYLKEKLLEEVREYLESGCVEELVDIEEVIRAILDLKGISYKTFEILRQEKADRRGTFTKRVCLEKVESGNV